MVAFCSTVKKISLTVVCWSSQQSTLRVDFKVECIEIQEKENEILYIDS